MAIIVKRKKSESKDELIGKFRRIFLEEDISEEIKNKTAYKKPSELRYAKKKINIWRKKCRKRARRSGRNA